LEVLHRLVNLGNTVIVIEHNLDVIKTADWIIDLGPGAGVNGGYIVAVGTPQEISRASAPFSSHNLATLSLTKQYASFYSLEVFL
jgi:excinuclease ABC subunit A